MNQDIPINRNPNPNPNSNMTTQITIGGVYNERVSNGLTSYLRGINIDFTDPYAISQAMGGAIMSLISDGFMLSDFGISPMVPGRIIDDYSEDSLEGDSEKKDEIDYEKYEKSKKYGKKFINCSHKYHRYSVYCDICKKTYPCEKCHEMNMKSNDCININQVFKIICNYCDKVQDKHKTCKKCKRDLFKRECEKCNIVTDKYIHHCEKCQHCVFGKCENLKHCKKCDCCIEKKMYKEHICTANKLDEQCCVCFEKLRTTYDYKILKCNHVMHGECYEKLITDNIKCPLCSKTIIDNPEKKWKENDEEVKSERTKIKYLVDIKCNDCEKECMSNWHSVGYKCSNCGSYNTRKK